MGGLLHQAQHTPHQAVYGISQTPLHGALRRHGDQVPHAHAPGLRARMRRGPCKNVSVAELIRDAMGLQHGAMALLRYEGMRI